MLVIRRQRFSPWEADKGKRKPARGGSQRENAIEELVRIKLNQAVTGTSLTPDPFPRSTSSLPGRLPSASRGWLWAVFWIGILLAVLPGMAREGEWAQLGSRKDLAPESLLHFFADFRFELGDRAQDPETFLQRKRGDCDDFARLAASLLAERGYKTKPVVIMMQGQTHAVCYVQEAHGFLDFNHRADADSVVSSTGSLEDIALKVSTYFRSKWWMASEVSYEGSTPVYLDSTFPSAPTPASA